MPVVEAEAPKQQTFADPRPPQRPKADPNWMPRLVAPVDAPVSVEPSAPVALPAPPKNMDFVPRLIAAATDEKKEDETPTP